MKKLKSKRGVTLTEMLCVLVIVSLIGVTLVTGVQLGFRSFGRSVSVSEGKVLCATLSTAVKNELRYATHVVYREGKYFFASDTIGQNACFSQKDGRVMLENSELGARDLISKGSYTYGATAALDIQSYDENSRIFTVKVTVFGQDKTKPLAQSVFDVQCIDS